MTALSHLPMSLPSIALLGIISSFTTAQTADVTYAKDVAPILNTYCIECHGADKTKASLRLDTPKGIMDGSNSGPIIVLGHPEQSKLVTVISLPPGDDDIMPSKGDPLTKANIAIISAWIQQGADFGDAAPVTTDVATSIVQVIRPTAFEVRSQSLPVPDPQMIKAYQDIGGVVRPMDPSGKTLEINLSHAKLSIELLEGLKRLGPNIVWLDLGGAPITDDHLVLLKPLTSLEKLDLSNTKVTDTGLVQLINMKELRFLSLVGTGVSDGGLYRLAGLKNLERVYLWNSKATKNGGARLQASLPNGVVNVGP